MVRASRSPYAPMTDGDQRDRDDGRQRVRAGSPARGRSTRSVKSASVRSARRTYAAARPRTGTGTRRRRAAATAAPTPSGRAAATAGATREQQRQPAEPDRDHGGQPQRERQLGPDQAAQQRLADRALLRSARAGPCGAGRAGRGPRSAQDDPRPGAACGVARRRGHRDQGCLAARTSRSFSSRVCRRVTGSSRPSIDDHVPAAGQPQLARSAAAAPGTTGGCGRTRRRPSARPASPARPGPGASRPRCAAGRSRPAPRPTAPTSGAASGSCRPARPGWSGRPRARAGRPPPGGPARSRAASTRRSDSASRSACTGLRT